MTTTQPAPVTLADPMGLTGRVAIVTGGAKGIGRAIVTTLARYGVRVAITDRDTDALEQTVKDVQAAGGTAHGYIHDVTDATATAQMVENVLKDHGAIDILVNNAGVSKGTPFLDIDEGEWDRVNDINCKAVFFTCKAVAPHMITQRHGKIVNISSIAGKETTPLFTHYSAAKFGVIAITQGLAKELAEYSINVNAVCPGIVWTSLWEPLLHQLSETKSITEAEAFEEFVAQIPLRRPQDPLDVAEAVAFLASDRARNITGQGLNVCGGMQLH
jgi:meso-butanediol dehydrogenase/(S,S)-butanediol dehydrogenase/diacetyl reductase